MSMVDTAPGKIQVRDLNFYYGKFHAPVSYTHLTLPTNSRV